MFQKNKKGFTLIELMVVIAIIAILATVVLVALQGARDAAENSKRKSAVSQIRSLAEIEYATESESYDALDEVDTEGNYIYDQVDVIQEEHPDLVVHSTDDGYCAYLPLKGDNSGYFCVSNETSPREYDNFNIGSCASGEGNQGCANQ